MADDEESAPNDGESTNFGKMNGSTANDIAESAHDVWQAERQLTNDESAPKEESNLNCPNFGMMDRREKISENRRQTLNCPNFGR